MNQLHKCFTDEQVSILLQGDHHSLLPRVEVQGMVGVADQLLLTDHPHRALRLHPVTLCPHSVQRPVPAL
jgi:hypothetical protein